MDAFAELGIVQNCDHLRGAKLVPSWCQAGAKGQGQQRFHYSLRIILLKFFKLFAFLFANHQSKVSKDFITVFNFCLQITNVQLAVVVSNVGIIALPLFTMDRKIRNHGEKLHCKEK